MSNYVVTFPLKTERWQESYLFSRFEVGRMIYNSLVNITQKRYKEMIKTKRYRNLTNLLSGNSNKDKLIWNEINDIRKEYRLTEYDFYKDVAPMQHHFKKSIDSFTAQKIAAYLWCSYEKLFYGNGKKVHYKKYGTMNSLQGKSNNTGIKFRDGYIKWIGLKIPVMIDYKNPYEVEAIKGEVKYCTIIKKYVRSKYKYYVQITFSGTPPTKHFLGKGDVGIDIGVSTVAVVSENTVTFRELADKVQNIENQKRVILRKMDRSRRITNPLNYNKDGTIRKQGNKKVEWHKSNHYIKLQNQLRELYRKQKDIRKYQHECMANFIVSLGDNHYVETMNFNALSKKSKDTKINDNGKIHSKKRFGKSIANRAPSMLLSIIDRKLKYFDKRLIKIDTYNAKASQFNHIDNVYKKKKLSDRWNEINGYKIQRDLYSAFLIMNIDESLKGFDMDKCNERFNSFLNNHNAEISRLSDIKRSGYQFLSCMGI